MLIGAPVSRVLYSLENQQVACFHRLSWFILAVMQAIQIQETGGPEVLHLVELPIPQPGPGQVLLRVEATGVNFVEIYFRKGLYKAALPFTPGS